MSGGIHFGDTPCAPAMYPLRVAWLGRSLEPSLILGMELDFGSDTIRAASFFSFKASSALGRLENQHDDRKRDHSAGSPAGG